MASLHNCEVYISNITSELHKHAIAELIKTSRCSVICSNSLSNSKLRILLFIMESDSRISLLLMIVLYSILSCNIALKSLRYCNEMFHLSNGLLWYMDTACVSLYNQQSRSLCTSCASATLSDILWFLNFLKIYSPVCICLDHVAKTS